MRARRSRSTTRRSSRWSTTWSLPPTPRTSCTRVGGSSRTRWRPCRSWRCPPTSTTRSRTRPTSWSVTSFRTATWRCPWRRAGSSCPTTGPRRARDRVRDCQSVHETRNFFARYLQVPDGNVRVTTRDVGGGFGQKMFVYREECAVALASYLLGRPVKWIEDRRENLLSAGHSRNEYAHVRMAVDGDGIIQAITAEAKADVGAYAVCPAAIDPMLVPGPYKIPRYGFGMEMSWTNTMGKAAYRGPWMFETTAREVAMDYVAHEIGLDPAEFRRRNLLSASDLPVHRTHRQRVPGDHAAGDTRAGARDPRLRRVPRGAGDRAHDGSVPRCRDLRLRGTDLDGDEHPGHRGRHRQDRRLRAGRGLPRHHLTRSEHRDDHGPDRRRPPRRRVRGRHHRAGRFAVDAVRPRHRREPHGGGGRRQRRARRPSPCARRS